MATVTDSGGNNLVSLAGLRSAPGFGLQQNSYLKTALIAISIGANPKRMWYLVQNNPTSTDYLYVYLAPNETTTVAAARLAPGDSFFIGPDNPWTGPITIYSGVLGVTCFETECELIKAAKT